MEFVDKLGKLGVGTGTVEDLILTLVEKINA